jgi:integrase
MARYTVHTAKGPKRRHIYGRTRQQVAAKLAKAMSDRDGGIELDPSRVTVNEYLQRWLKDSVKGSVRPITFESYERLVRVHVVPALGRIKLKALSPAHLQGFYRDRLDAGLSPCTVQRLHAVIHRALKQALRWGLVARNVSDTPKGGRRLGPPKRSKSRRSVKLTAGAVKALTAHGGRQLEEREKLAELWQDQGFVFTTQVGTPLNRHNFFRRCFKPMLDKAGLPHTVRFHDLRHTCATILLSKNVNPKIVQELLGHANISQTMDTYSHVLPDMQERAASAMDDMFP